MLVLVDSLKSAALVFHVHVSNVCVLFNQHHFMVQFMLHQGRLYIKGINLAPTAELLLTHGLLLQE